MPGPEGFESSQKKLFASLKADLSLFESRKNREIASYERSFRRHLPKKTKPATKKNLLRMISKSRVVLVGDFHPFRQSQKGFLRLVEESAGKVKRPVLAMECFLQDGQAAVDQYLSHSITAEELREQVEFESYWPFSWENYREILAFARDHEIPVIALNVAERKRNSRQLRLRDRAAANRIAAEIAKFPESTIFVLYGELHLARPHIPRDLQRQLGQNSRVLVVHQNEPEIYWQAPKQRNGQRPEVLQLREGEFCILNSVPWVKLRSYLDWLEGSPDSENEDGSVDTASLVHHYAAMLAEACGLSVPVASDVEILGPEQIESSLPGALERLKPSERILLSHACRFHRTACAKRSRALFLPSTSTNALSEAAAYLLWLSFSKPGDPRSLRKPSPSSRVAQFFIGYFGSKVLNPKRKCNEVQDLRELFRREKKLGRPSRKNRVIRRSLSLLSALLAQKPRLPAEQGALPGALEIEACRLAGFVLGERFFQALLRDPSLLPLAHEWFRAIDEHSLRDLLLRTSARLSKRPTLRKRDRF
jgi:uncharacterized iron-regulated protein